LKINIGSFWLIKRSSSEVMLSLLRHKEKIFLRVLYSVENQGKVLKIVGEMKVIARPGGKEPKNSQGSTNLASPREVLYKKTNDGRWGRKNE